MLVVPVRLGEKSYSIYIGSNTFEKIPQILRKLNLGKKTIIITTVTLYKLFGKCVENPLKKDDFCTSTLYIPDGERSKCPEVVMRLYENLLKIKADRKSTILALGGGTVSDVAGFVAATYMRGINWVIIPTSLLSQVDSCIGGKVGINCFGLKNLIGTFYQPKAVIIDLKTLESLPMREFNSGLAEAIKYGMILDKKLFFYLERNLEKIKSFNEEVLKKIVSTCCRIKASIVEKDERDEKDIRILLNYGHTLGHALEMLNYKTYTHGEAVAIGMYLEAKIAEEIGILNSSAVKRLKKLICSIGLPTTIKKLKEKKIIEYIQKDKKVQEGKIRFALPIEIGKGTVVENINEHVLYKVLKESKKYD